MDATTIEITFICCSRMLSIAETQHSLLKVKYQRSACSAVRLPDCLQVFSPNGTDFFYLDFEDEDLVQYAWFEVNGYFGRRTSRRHPTHAGVSVYVHQLVLERVLNRRLEKGELCDHIDWVKSNNRRSNLRIAGKPENAYNSHRTSCATPELKGVSAVKGRYRMRIQYSVSIEDYFDSAEEAARKYDEYAAMHHKTFAVFNYPDEWIFDHDLNQWRRK